MHVRVRLFGKPEAIVVVESKLTKIEKFRCILKDKFNVPPKLQRLLYGGKLLEDGYTFHDYNIKLNDVIQLMVRVQPDPTLEENKTKCEENTEEDKDKETEYEDCISLYYAVGDLIDMRDSDGSWYEGTVMRIVKDPDSIKNKTNSINEISINNVDQENKPPEGLNVENSKPKSGIQKYFTKASIEKKKPLENKPVKNTAENGKNEVDLLYKVQLHVAYEGSIHYCKLNEIRPRARAVIDLDDVKIGQTVMINYNIDSPFQIGYWYDLKVSKIEKSKKSNTLVGTLYLGAESIPQNDTAVTVLDKIYAIETIVPLSQRTEQYKALMTTPTETRSRPLKCLKCRDDVDRQCRYCGCYKCASKESPEKILLCDECDYGFHMSCLDPPLTKLPDGDWYCPSCKRDPNEVVAPGAAVQIKKDTGNSSRDWGRGMACVGKTKTCSMPANHFGPIPGIEVGMCWRFRIQLSESGVHRPPVSGIHGRDVEGAYSIVLSGGYEDDVDNGIEFTYTGSGGRDLSGNKRTAEQSCDQKLVRENRALARNCAVNKINEEGGDAADDWKKGKPVRVVRSYKMLKHFPKYAPKEGIRYDGIYKVVKYYPEKGLSGYRVWKYLLRRDDPSPAPWERGAKEFDMIYPDGYLEAEAEKKALREKKKTEGAKKRSLRASDGSDNEKVSPVNKKRKADDAPKKKGRPPNSKSETKGKIVSLFEKSPKNAKSKGKSENDAKNLESVLTQEERDIIATDKLNAKLWEECFKICEKKGRREFVEHVERAFVCIICQDAAANPVTTPCLHNYCSACLNLAFKRTESKCCPCCRHNLTDFELEPNQQLTAALRAILPGYDAGKK